MPRFPLIPTIVVAVAVATMIALGFWQLGRLEEKEALIARYERAAGMSSDVPWPKTPLEFERALFRHARIDCIEIQGIEAVSGRSSQGQSGWAHIARCSLAEGGMADIGLGWSRKPDSPSWSGGEVGGFIGPYKKEIKLVASPAQAGLDQLALPDPSELPNNHLAYAWQWFIFAATALVIYVLALKRKQRDNA